MKFLRSQDQGELVELNNLYLECNEEDNIWELLSETYNMVTTLGQWDTKDKVLMELDRIEAWLNDPDSKVVVFQIGQ